MYAPVAATPRCSKHVSAMPSRSSVPMQSRRDVLKLSALALPQIAGAAPKVASKATSPFFSVRDFGASGDALRLDTAAINAAIEAAAAAGGGTVIFPAGQYLTFSIR